MHRFIAAAAFWMVSWVAGAATVAGVTPQGEVAQVRQVTVRFAQAVVPLGDPRLPDPFALQCVGTVPAGAGRWINDRAWVWDFREPLPPGTQCTLTAKPDWKPTDGALTGTTRFAFSTGGPAVVSILPRAGSDAIEEDQHFLMTLTGPVVEASLADHAWCEVEGLGERLPLVVVTGALRDEVLKSNNVLNPAVIARTLLVHCGRPLPHDTAMRLIWSRGLAAAANPQVVTSVEQRFRFKTRSAFTASFSCERENADAACLPIRPMRLRFSVPIDRATAAQVRLVPAGGTALAPVFDKDDRDPTAGELVFPVPLPEKTVFTIELPKTIRDDAGRPLANAGDFPMKTQTAEAPPIAKFAAAPFGVVELNGDPVLPVTLRHVQGDLRPAASTGQVRVKRLESDADILTWLARVERYHESQLTAKEAGLPENDWYTVEEDTNAKGEAIRRRVERRVGTRELSLLKQDPDAKRLDLPALQGGDPRPFEVVGIPLPEPGYHVVEIESARLGASLLARAAPMFVRTGVLTTNLGVHFKQGRENALVWVTTLDKGRPVADADIAVRDCNRQAVWQGRTDAQGIARVDRAIEPPRHCDHPGDIFVSARKSIADGPMKGRTDVAFVFASWQKGIESWRFNLPTASGTEPDVQAHTVFDRTLLRAGETVSMKHFIRLATSAGLAAMDPSLLPTRLKITHQGSGQAYVQPLAWNGARDAVSTWNIPAAARLGVYDVTLERDGLPQGTPRQRAARSWSAGDFRVEEFRLPLIDARVAGPKALQVAPTEVPVSVQLNYLSGGGMGQAAARASAVLKARAPNFSGYDDWSFEPPRQHGAGGAQQSDDADARDDETRLVADKLPLITDRNGAATVAIKDLPPVVRPSELLTELTFNDPNGEVQTASARIALWPSAVVVGIRAGSWASSRGRSKFSAVALDTSGKALVGQAVSVKARLTQTISTRKRMVGGFYAYDNRDEVKELGTLCDGKTDDRGLLLCEASLDAAGQVELVAEAKDASGHASTAAASVWITRQGELWFDQSNDDRMDVLPEKKRYEPGETARLQVRMPFREATALVAVEREGIIETRVVTLRGDDPTVELKIAPGWGPNVYVSVLALRGRIREVPWYSFFTWGWKTPVDWARAFWYEGRQYQAPTALVDLSKPAFKLGVAALKVGIASHALQVVVTPDKPAYTVRGKALATIRVTQDGKPLAGTQVAFAAVDEGLLALRANASWDLLGAMIQDRGWGVETSTAQSEIIGRRHYGRKAVAAGGGGGRGGTRELFDTLLVWRPNVVLDANGEATVEVPLNDSLTSFRLVAIADAGVDRFGTGAASIRVTQDLQVLAGLPPLVREGDRFSAMLTLRNTTPRAMKVRATLKGTVDASSVALDFPPMELTLAPDSAQEVAWPVDVPAEAGAIAWDAGVDEIGGTTKGRLKLTQRVAAAVPIRVLQATLAQLDGSTTLPIAAPADALPETGSKRGGLNVSVQPRLTGALPGIRRYFATYPFICLEQKVSKSVGLKDAAMWAGVANALPTYLDSDGLANYFPPRSDDTPRGSDRLTAYLLAATREAGFELPPASRDRLLDGLAAFVEGRLQRKFWAPPSQAGMDLDVRKLAAIEALSRYGRARPAMIGSINLTPNLWPTAAVIDWLRIQRQVPGLPDSAKRIDEANQILRSRLTYAGTTLRFSNESGDFWWWLMDSADANAARLILGVMDDPAWRDDLPRMVVGSLARQQGGHWLTTTANLWGSLALDRFSAKFESVPVGGRTVATTGSAPQAIDWTKHPAGGAVQLPWPDKPGTLTVTQDGTGKPWLTVQSLAAIPLKAPLRAGYGIERSVTAVEQKVAGRWSRGDVMRIHLDIDAQTDMTWVVIADPVPAGATQLGSGLGRDSQIAASGEKRSGATWPVFEERGFEAFRSYFDYLPRGRHVVEYTVRLNNPGRFALPPTRVEAMYSPETFGELPNAAVEVGP